MHSASGGIPCRGMGIEQPMEGLQIYILKLGGMTGGPHKVAQYRNVGAISPYAACIYGEAKTFGGFQVNSGIIEF